MAQYVVSRPLYTEDTFTNEYKKIHRQHKTMMDHVKQYFT